MTVSNPTIRYRAVVDLHRHELLANTAVEAVIQAPGSEVAVAPRLTPSARILFVTSEMGDFVKAGGLGEVSAALPRALRAFGDVRVLIPGYRALRDKRPTIDVVSSMPGTADLPPWSLGRVKAADGLDVYVVLCDELYNRPGSPYGDEHGEAWWDNDIRFGRLSLAAAEIAAGTADPNWHPDLVHVNDWPSALAPGYMRWRGVETPTILTVHNLAYQGVFPAERVGPLAIPDQAFNVQGAEFHGQVSFLKAGLFYASQITTVSETYAREITTPEHGVGLDGLLRDRLAEGRLTGIVNGIDDSWVPPTLANSSTPLAWKSESARAVRHAFGLSASRGPMFAIVSRLVHQKGIDLSIDAAEWIVQKGGQLVVTGRGEAQIEDAVAALARRFPGQVGARIGFDDAEARAMYEASDFLLMPSRFEPCGLSQMYAQRLGVLPIAYRTGGLADTIEDGRSGFLFSQFNSEGLKNAVGRAFGTFRRKPMFRRMRKHAMSKTFGWSGSASRYASLYASALAAP
jgi:starch synthase